MPSYSKRSSQKYASFTTCRPSIRELWLIPIASLHQESSKRLTSRSFYLILRKKEHKAEFWPRLQKTKQKSNFIRTDFSKWVDEDEQDGEKAIADDLDMENAMGGGGMGMGGMPGGMPGMGGMGGMGDMGGMDIQKVGHPLQPDRLPGSSLSCYS